MSREIDEERIIAKLTYYMRVVLSKDKNRRKGGWNDLLPLTCVTRARQETYEAIEAIVGNHSVDEICEELADAAAFLAMAMDNVIANAKLKEKSRGTDNRTP